MTHVEERRIEILWTKVVDIYTDIKLRGYASRLGIHDLDHVRRVRHNVQLILSEDSNQRDKVSFAVVQAAAMLHDLGYSQLTKPETEKREHVGYSLELCEDLLQQAGFAKDEIARVQSIILSHHDVDHAAKSLEQKILYVADKVDMIGLDGTVRMFMRYASLISDRDQVARKLLDDLRERVENDLLQVGIGYEIVKSRWAETEWLLREILARGEGSPTLSSLIITDSEGNR